MSLNGAMLSGVSSLIANSSALGAISDNISNIDTVGYKQNEVQFADLVSAQAGTGLYNSGGVQSDVSQLVSQQGQFQQTSSATNLAINGNGMFVVSQTSSGVTSTSAPLFTRAGAFTPNSEGFLVNTAGDYLLGWPANADGVVSPNPSQLSSLAPINVDAIEAAPSASTTATLNANLDSQQYAAGAASQAVENNTYSASSATTSMAAYDAGLSTGSPPDFSTQVTVYDQQGGSHTLQLDFLKTQSANTWNVEINSIPADAVTSANGQIAQGTVTFNSDGTFQSTTLPAGGAPSTSGALDLSVPWSAASGLGTQALTLNLNSATGGLTQYATASTTNSTTVDGGPASTISGVNVTTAGLVQANFANGTTKTIAQVALATFPNYNGLTPMSGTSYAQSSASGTYTLDEPQQGSAGSIQSSELESSTVDLSTEFTNLIVTQNAYTAASKIITTADTMEQVLEQVIVG